MTNKLPGRLSGLALLILLAAAGCNENRKDPPKPPVVVTPTPAEDSFGTGFGAAYRASPNSDPRTPADGDIIPLTLTQDAKVVG